MHVERDRYGKNIPVYNTTAEKMRAIENYLKGNYGALTRLEVEFLRECLEDPANRRWEREHAGCFADNVSQWDLDELVFVHDLGKTLEEGRQLVLAMIGPHPITILTIDELDRELAAKVYFNH